MAASMKSTSHSPRNKMTITSFTITQPFLGAPIQFNPCLGSAELDSLVDAYIVGFASKQEKLSEVTIDFYKYATVDISTGALVRRYEILPAPYATSPSIDFSPSSIFTPSPSSGYNSSFVSQTPPAVSTQRMKGARVAKKPTKKESKAAVTARLPGFSIMTKDGIDVTTSAGRGTKTKEQREHAHLMRIMKACDACKRKKIRCDPSHRRSASIEMSRTASDTSKTPSLSKRGSTSSSSQTYSNPSLTPQSSFNSQYGVANSMDDFVLFPEDASLEWNPADLSAPLPDLTGSELVDFDFGIDFSAVNTLPDDIFDSQFLYNDFPGQSSQQLSYSNIAPEYFGTDQFAIPDDFSSMIQPRLLATVSSGESPVDHTGSFTVSPSLSPTSSSLMSGLSFQSDNSAGSSTSDANASVRNLQSSVISPSLASSLDGQVDSYVPSVVSPSPSSADGDASNLEGSRLGLFAPQAGPSKDHGVLSSNSSISNSGSPELRHLSDRSSVIHTTDGMILQDLSSDVLQGGSRLSARYSLTSSPTSENGHSHGSGIGIDVGRLDRDPQTNPDCLSTHVSDRLSSAAGYIPEEFRHKSSTARQPQQSALCLTIPSTQTSAVPHGDVVETLPTSNTSPISSGHQHLSIVQPMLSRAITPESRSPQGFSDEQPSQSYSSSPVLHKSQAVLDEESSSSPDCNLNTRNTAIASTILTDQMMSSRSLSIVTVLASLIIANLPSVRPYAILAGMLVRSVLTTVLFAVMKFVPQYCMGMAMDDDMSSDSSQSSSWMMRVKSRTRTVLKKQSGIAMEMQMSGLQGTTLCSWV